MAQKVMQLLDVNTGHMQYKVCGAEHVADLKGDGPLSLHFSIDFEGRIGV